MVPLVEDLPGPVKQAIEGRGEPGDDLVIAIAGDVTRTGSFGEEWLVVTQDTVSVYEPNGAIAHSRLNVQLRQVRSPHAESLVGGGAILATIDGKTVELIRYTNASERKFSRAAKYLEEVTKHLETLEKGEESAAEPKVEEDTDEAKRCPNCKLLLEEGTRVCPVCMNKRKVVARLAQYIRPYWKQTAIIWVLMLINTFFGLVTPYLNKPLMDVVLSPRGHPAPTSYRLALLGWLVLAMLGALLIGQAVGIIQGRIATWLGARLSHDLRVQLYQHLQLLSLKYFDKKQTGAIMSRVTQDSESLEQVLIDGAQFLVVNLLRLIGIVVILLVMDWKLTLLVLVPAPAVIVMSRLFWPRMFAMWERFWHYRQRLSAALNDSLSGIRVVKAFAQEGQEIRRFNARSSDMQGAGMAAEITWQTYFPIMTTVMTLGSLLVWYVGGREVLGRETSIGTLMTFIAYLGQFYGPMQFLSRIVDYLSRGLAAAERIFEVLDSEPDVREYGDAIAMPHIEGRVEFRNVTFGYDKHKPILKDVDLVISPGEMIGFVGHSGAGKSTTINLICRFYDVQQGQLLIDGVDIRKIHQQDLRSQIGVVLQDTFLFSGSILENISYARPDASREEIMAAAKAAHAHDFIVKKPDGYDTPVGERGQSLSGGERQRISIARAILHNPRILILDEATSSVDTDTEKQIQDAIARLVKGRTTFAIAHRLSTLRNADRLVVLKGGKVEELGTHDELMEKKGEFYRLVEMQQEMSRINAVAR